MLGEGSKKKRRRHKRAIASVFFRFSHRDKDGNYLKNKQQSSIVNLMKQDIINKRNVLDGKTNTSETNQTSEEEKESPLEIEYVTHQSATYIPYYDKIPLDTAESLEEDEFELLNDESPSSDRLSVIARSKSTDSPIAEERKNSMDPAPISLPKSENIDRFKPI